MGIEKLLTEEQFKEYPEEDQSLYVKGQDGKYAFVGENAGELRRAKIRVAADLTKAQRERDEALKKLAEKEQSHEEAEREKEIKSTTDVKKIEEYWQTKLNKVIQEKDATIQRWEQSALNQYRDSLITSQAAKLALPEHEYVVKLALEKRINAKMDAEGRPQTVIYDAHGQAGHDTLDDLIKEFKADSRFKRLLKGSEHGSGTVKQQTDQPPAPPSTEPKTMRQLTHEFGEFSGTQNPDQLVNFLQSKSPARN